ncbi:MAG: hypothetical protein HOA17_08750 [Candidatus Melainabacteria bacterium]|jgi:hypothetical protein|nr:hypothetical protein [Candidatus Melainabacteria bacterium]
MNLIKSAEAVGSNIKSKLDHSYIKAQKARRDIGHLYSPNPVKAQRARNKLRTQAKELAESSSNIIAKAAGELAGALVPIPVISQFTNSTAENLLKMPLAVHLVKLPVISPKPCFQCQS